MGELDELLEWREIPVGGEHARRGDQRSASLGLTEPPREVLDVAVAVDEELRARESAAVDDRRRCQLVGEDDVARPSQGWDHAGGGVEVGAEQHRALAPAEGGEALLEPAVDRHRARLEPRRPGAHAPPGGGVGRGLGARSGWSASPR